MSTGGMKHTKGLIALFLMVFLAACVTTTTNERGYSDKINDEQAVQSSVTAAREYLSRGDSDNALRHLRVALDTGGDQYAEVHSVMAYAFEIRMDFDQADVHYREAIEIDPELSSARNNYGVFLYKQGRYDEARSQFEVVTADLLYERRAASFMSLGLCELKLDNVTGAEYAFERSLALDRGYPAPMLELADIYIAQNSVVKAERFYNAYRAEVSRQNPRGLLIGIKIALKSSDKDALASYTLALKNLYPESDEYKEYVSEYSSES
ncbi:MAG: type IV pilus biogenesis/stability protein PilW [Pseudomonadales bacterium]